LYALAKEANIPISKGYKRYVIYRERHNGIIFKAIQNQIAVVEKCNA